MGATSNGPLRTPTSTSTRPRAPQPTDEDGARATAMNATIASRRYLSPLRYPGGKARMAGWLSAMVDLQVGWLDADVLVEPFAGGLGAGLALLDQRMVSEVWFCEANDALRALWQAILDDLEEVAGRVAKLGTVTLRDYDAAVDLIGHPGEATQIDVAVAALLVNRCSRSGMVSPRVGPIGGRHQQGRWKINDRFDPAGIAARLRLLAPLTGRMRLLGEDGIECIEQLDGEAGVEDEVMLFVDPPYLGQGQRLYRHGGDENMHHRLAEALRSTPARWALTYDDHPAAFELYEGFRKGRYSWRQTANRARSDAELLIVSDSLVVPDTRIGGADIEWCRCA